MTSETNSRTLRLRFKSLGKSLGSKMHESRTFVIPGPLAPDPRDACARPNRPFRGRNQGAKTVQKSPSILNVRNHVIRYRVSDEELARITVLARLEGFTLSKFSRTRALWDRILSEVVTTPGPAYGEISPGDRLIADQIRRMGINLNQIAHMQNMLRVPAPPELGPLLLEIRRYMDVVRARQEP